MPCVEQYSILNVIIFIQNDTNFILKYQVVICQIYILSQDYGNARYTMAKCTHVLRTHKLAIHNRA